MKREKTRMTVSWLSTALLVVLLSKPGAAGDIALNAYLEFPLGGGSPFFGLRAGPDSGIYSGTNDDPTKTPRTEFELRYDAEGRPAFLVNGFPITRSLILNASDDGGSKETINDFDWRSIVGAALGIGLIVAIVTADDTTVNVCSGSNCPPKERPPPEPDPTDSSK